MKALRAVVVLAVCAGMHPVVKAEFRPWTDLKGNSIEAEYVRTADETVVLRRRDGAEIKVPLASLCDKDRTHAMLQCPPEIEITVDDKLDRKTLGYAARRTGSDKIEMQSIKAEIALRKASFERYEPELTLELFLIGSMEQLNRYVIIERSTAKFSFTDQNKGLYMYTCGPFELRNVSGNRRVGAEYEGYLLAVRDDRDEIVALKSSRLEFENNAPVLLKAQKGNIFDEDFNLVRAESGQKPRRGRSF